MADRAFECQLQGWSLTTAEIMYRMPDHRHLFQLYLWQDYDLAPKFPRLTKFLDFWAHNLDGPLAEVRVAHSGLMGPALLRHVDHEWRLH
jgi:uncharacterized protein Usg